MELDVQFAQKFSQPNKVILEELQHWNMALKDSTTFKNQWNG